MTAPTGFAGFNTHKYLSLETFKKSGEGVRTPIWFAADPRVGLDSSAAKLYVYTIGDTGKVKADSQQPARADCTLRHAGQSARRMG